MRVFVVDASAALAALAPNQGGVAADAFFAQSPVLIAPSLFAIEVRHALLRLERRRLIPAGAGDANLAIFEASVNLEPPPDDVCLSAIMVLARAEGLSVYDAAYLDLALRRGAVLASRDSSLIAAARRRDAEAVDLR